MRTIGKKNILLVQGLTKREVKIGTPHGEIEERVIAQIPSEVFDIWEMSYLQITNIIEETIHKY